MLDKDSFYLNQEEPNQSCFLALRNIISSQDNLITETIKYGCPCFCYKNRVFCYLWKDKKTGYPYLLMVEGKLLKHPELEAGTRKKMKVFNVNPNKDIQLESVIDLLQEAIDLYRNGIIKSK